MEKIVLEVQDVSFMQRFLYLWSSWFVYFRNKVVLFFFVTKLSLKTAAGKWLDVCCWGNKSSFVLEVISVGLQWSFASVVYGWVGGDWDQASWVETGIRWKIWIDYKSRPLGAQCYKRHSERVPDQSRPSKSFNTNFLKRRNIWHPRWRTLSGSCLLSLCWDLSKHR